ncbi:MAG TPA: NAD(P)-dependent oxidoreductase [Roseiflexaceae bacterium]|nr:NAD(P)-dependent oxidoreductase [Roseiflexaceae bacterium]
MPTRVLLDPSFRRLETIFTAEDLQRVYDAGDVLWAKNEPMPDEAVEQLRDELDVIITGSWRYGHPGRFPRLRAIIEVGGSFPSPALLDYAYCFQHGIRVLSCAPAFGPAVAELGLGLALAATRQIAWTDRHFRTGEPNWSHTSFETEIGEPFTLYGKTVGLIGYGGLAHSLRPLLAPFGCRLQVFDPWLTDTYVRRQGLTPVGLDELLATSKVIFVLATPSSSNKALLDRDRLELIRPDAVFVLLSRSHVVDFDVLTELLAQGRFRAAIDVFPVEPIAADHPIRKVEHAVLSSHRAGANRAALHNVGRIVADDLEAICAGKVPMELQAAQPEFIRLRG